MSVKGSLVSKESSASTALAPTAAAHAPKARWEMGRHVQVSTVVLCLWHVNYYIFRTTAKTIFRLKTSSCVHQQQYTVSCQSTLEEQT